MTIICLFGSLFVSPMLFAEPSDIQSPNTKQLTQKTMEKAAQSLERLKEDCFRYPSTEDGWGALVHGMLECDSYDPDSYLKKIPQDAWGRTLTYKNTASGFKILSYGKDGKPGGEGLNEDLVFP